jgi:hypothetical protein
VTIHEHFPAPVAQLDRAGGFYPPGWGFESLRGYQCRALSLGAQKCRDEHAGCVIRVTDRRNPTAHDGEDPLASKTPSKAPASTRRLGGGYWRVRAAHGKPQRAERRAGDAPDRQHRSLSTVGEPPLTEACARSKRRRLGAETSGRWYTNWYRTSWRTLTWRNAASSVSLVLSSRVGDGFWELGTSVPLRPR